MIKDCPDCDGTGDDCGDRCPNCDGTGAFDDDDWTYEDGVFAKLAQPSQPADTEGK